MPTNDSTDQGFPSPLQCAVKSAPVYDHFPEDQQISIKAEPEDDVCDWQNSCDEFVPSCLEVCLKEEVECNRVESEANTSYEQFPISSPVINHETCAETPDYSQGSVQGLVDPSPSIIESVEPETVGCKPPWQSLVQLHMTRQRLGPVAVQPETFQDFTELLPPANASPEFVKALDDAATLGWMMLHGVRIPFIVRHEDKFVALRVIEHCYLKDDHWSLYGHMYSATYVEAFLLTDEEAGLLSEVNAKSCNGQFGHDVFSHDDALLRLEEADAFLQFLTLSQVMLNHTGTLPENQQDLPFGILNMGGVATPYVKRGEEKYVPLSMCDFDSDGKSNCWTEVETVQGWEMAYLNFCAMQAEVKFESPLQNDSPLVAVKVVEQKMGAVVPFEEWWPAKPSCGPAIAAVAVTPISFWARRQGGVFVSGKAGLIELQPGTPYPSMLHFHADAKTTNEPHDPAQNPACDKELLNVQHVASNMEEKCEADNYNEENACIVPNCTSTLKNNPSKVFICVPTDTKRKRQWLRAIHQSEKDFPKKTKLMVCQDHFNLEEDMQNYMQFKLVGGRKCMKAGVVPHIFDCQEDGTRSAAHQICRSAAIKRKRTEAVNDALSLFESNEMQARLMNLEMNNCAAMFDPNHFNADRKKANKPHGLVQKLVCGEERPKFRHSTSNKDEKHDSHRPSVKTCIVPNCSSNSLKNPGKIFLSVPRNDKHKMPWIRALCRSEKAVAKKSVFTVCQEHFDMISPKNKGKGHPQSTHESSEPAPKTSSERSKEFRKRQRLLREGLIPWTPRPIPKTSTERSREFRERQRQLQEELGLLASKPAPKTSTERTRLFRKRQRQLQEKQGPSAPKPASKTSSERTTLFRERQRQRQEKQGPATSKPTPKTSAERTRLFRERQRQLQEKQGPSTSKLAPKTSSEHI